MTADPTIVRSKMFVDYSPRQTGFQSSSPPQDLILQEAALNDADGIAALLLEREGGTYSDAMERVQRHFRLPADQHQTVVAKTAGLLIGYGRIGHVKPAIDAPDDRPAGWYLSGVIVATSFRRRGVARELT